MDHGLVMLVAGDDIDPLLSHDWLALCGCGWESETPRRVPMDAWFDHCAHAARAARGGPAWTDAAA
jgi:hypothetical protein